MAWALVAEDNWGVTARMNVDFRKPVPIGRAVRAEGWITRSRRRVVDTEGPGSSTPKTGAELATGCSDLRRADEAQKRELRERYGVRIAPNAERIRPERWPGDAGLITHGETRRAAPTVIATTYPDRATSPREPSPSSPIAGRAPKPSARTSPSSSRTPTRSPAR